LTRTRQYGHDDASHYHHHFVLAWRRRLVWSGPLVLSQRWRGRFRSDAIVSVLWVVGGLDARDVHCDFVANPPY
jgi:hypothetical protein